MTKLFQGAGGGGESSGSSAVNTPDNLYAEDTVEFALALSEGPIRGLTQGAKSFYVGDTPLVNIDGTRNFDTFAVGVHPGYPEGTARALQLQLGGQSSSSSVGVTLLQNVAVTRQTDASLRGFVDELEVRLNIQRLFYTDSTNTYEGTVQFKLEYKKSTDSVWSNFYPDAVVSITGKTTSGYPREFRTTVPRITGADWQIRVTKLSVDNAQDHVNSVAWESFQCTTKTPAIFPDTAIVHGIGKANGQFSSLPDFSGVYDGILCRVPTNYNPDTRTYDETVPWNGSFKFAWTNNPAWVLYNLIVNTRYGLAASRLHVDCDRYDFYEAAKWCDQLVTLEDGSTEPRYTFNAVLTDPTPGLEMLSYVAGSFNAMIWDDLNGQIHLKVDKDEDAVMLFTPESVLADQTGVAFNYSYTDATERHNDITVSFINPDLDWNEDRRRIDNVTTAPGAIAKYGRVATTFVAVGCTSATEAIRKAQVRLLSAQTETTMVNFRAAKQGEQLSLFDVILIADPDMGWSCSRRITTFDSSYINFRDPIYIETLKNYTIKVQTPEGIFDVEVQPENTGNVTRFLLVGEMPDNVPRYGVFTLEEEGGFGLAKPFRVMNIEEVDQYTFAVQAIEINRTKYYLSETSTPIVEQQYSYRQDPRPFAPSNLTAESGDAYVLIEANGNTTPRIFATWKKPSRTPVSRYEFQWRRLNDPLWEEAKNVFTESAYVYPAVAGEDYVLRVRSIDTSGTPSDWLTLSPPHTVQGRSTLPPNVVSFSASAGLFQNILNWVYPSVPYIKAVEIKWNGTNSLSTASTLVTLTYPMQTFTHTERGSGVPDFYWIRTQDTSGNWSVWSTSISATPITSATKLLNQLVNSITTTQLETALNTRLDTYGTKITSLEGQYTVKIDSNGYVAGFGLANSGTTSSFVILADQFKIITPGNTAKTPFMVGAVNGVSTVGINGALLVDGTISAGAINVTSLSAITSTLGTVTISAGGYLNTAGALNYASGTGIWMGQDAGQYKLRIGNPSGNHLKWDGSNVLISTPQFTLDGSGNASFGGTLTAANMVTTSNIGANAVTLPVSAYTASGFSVTSYGVEHFLQSASIASTGAPIIVMVGAAIFAGTSGGVTDGEGNRGQIFSDSIVVTVYRNGSLIYQSAAVPGGSLGSIVIQDTPGAGTFTYSAYFYRVQNPSAPFVQYEFGTAANRSIVLLETKR